MEHWGFTLFFIFSLIVIIRNILLFIRKLYSTELTTYVLSHKELLLLGFTLSYVITYLIY